MTALWIAHARVLDPSARRDSPGDLFARDGRIVPSLTAAERRRARKIDARGLVACPGLVDIHVHLREPGQTHKETIGTGSRAAAAGGFTTSCACRTHRPRRTTPARSSSSRTRSARDAVVKVLPTGCITVGMKGQALAPFGSLKRAGIVALTDDGECVQSNELMRRAAEYARMFGLPMLDHCQDQSMTAGAVMNEGVVSTRLGLRGWPNAAEDIVVARDVILAKYTGARIHLQHVSSENAVEIIRRAKADGLPITAEATPHHFALTDEALAQYDPNFKMNPPLRTEADRRAVITGLRDGTLDCIATDHAPHTNYEKDREFDFAPNGVIGLETALPVALAVLVRESRFSLAKVVDLMTRRPARILGLAAGTLAPGAPADICLFDPEATWRYDARAGFSKSANSPWHGRTLTGRVKTTIVDGRPVFDGGRILRG